MDVMVGAWGAMMRRTWQETSRRAAGQLKEHRRGYRPPVATTRPGAAAAGDEGGDEGVGAAAAARLKRELGVRELEMKVADPRVQTSAEKSLLYGALAGPDKVAFTGFYVPEGSAGGVAQPQVLHALFVFGGGVCGHPGFVHGGALAAAIDESFGVGYYALAHVPLGFGARRGFTANLTVDYRAPVPSHTAARVHVELAGPVDGRKVFLKAKMVGLDTGILHAEATALFILEREASAAA